MSPIDTATLAARLPTRDAEAERLFRATRQPDPTRPPARPTDFDPLALQLDEVGGRGLLTVQDVWDAIAVRDRRGTPLKPRADVGDLRAYVTSHSVRAGQMLGVCVGIDMVDNPGVAVPDARYRVGPVDDITSDWRPIFAGSLPPMEPIAVPPTSPRYDREQLGYGWTPVSIPTGAGWEPGLYAIEISTDKLFSGGTTTTASAYFVVRRAVHTTNDPAVILCFPFATTIAYAGKNGNYENAYEWVHPQRARRMSLDRPLDSFTYEKRDRTLAGPLWMLRFLRSLAKPIRVDACTSFDLDGDPSTLDGYQLLICAGHDEYWSKQMRDRVESFVASGGNVAFFTGNTCWGHVRFEDGGRTMVCYKTSIEDPITGHDDSQVAALWPCSPTNRPENTLVGTSFRRGAQAPVKPRPYVVVATDPLLPPNFAIGTPIPFSNVAGVWDLNLLGYETDAVDFTVDKKHPNSVTNAVVLGAAYEPTGADGAPLNFKILAVADLRDSGARMPGWATMGYFTNVGTVFTAATTEWAACLADQNVAAMTEHVVNTLSTKADGPSMTRPVRRYPPNVGIGSKSLPPYPAPILVSYSWERVQTELHDVANNTIAGAAIAAGSTGHLFLLSRSGEIYRIDPENPFGATWERTNAPNLGGHSGPRSLTCNTHGRYLHATSTDVDLVIHTTKTTVGKLPSWRILDPINHDNWNSSALPGESCLGLATVLDTLWSVVGTKTGRWLYQEAAPITRWPKSHVALSNAPWEGRFYAADAKGNLLTRETVPVDLAWRKIGTVPTDTYALAVYFGRIFALAGSPITPALWWRAAVRLPLFDEPSILLLRQSNGIDPATFQTAKVAGNGDFTPRAWATFQVPFWDIAARVKDGHVLLYRQNGGADLVRFSSSGKHTIVRPFSQGSFESDSGTWSHIVCVRGNSDRVIFYDATSGDTAVGYFDGFYNFVELKRPALRMFWTHVVPLHSGVVLFYDAANNDCAIYEFAPDGTMTELRSGWSGVSAMNAKVVIPVGQSSVLFYHPVSGDTQFAEYWRETNAWSVYMLSTITLPAKRQLCPSADGLVLELSADDQGRTWGMIPDVTTTERTILPLRADLPPAPQNTVALDIGTLLP